MGKGTALRPNAVGEEGVSLPGKSKESRPNESRACAGDMARRKTTSMNVYAK